MDDSSRMDTGLNFHHMGSPVLLSRETFTHDNIASLNACSYEAKNAHVVVTGGT